MKRLTVWCVTVITEYKHQHVASIICVCDDDDDDDDENNSNKMGQSNLAIGGIATTLSVEDQGPHL